jgi:hypothetical protein
MCVFLFIAVYFAVFLLHIAYAKSESIFFILIVNILFFTIFVQSK